MSGQIMFDPLLPWPVVGVVAALALVAAGAALWRGSPGWWLRLLAGGALTLALANPALHDEDRDPLSDIVIAVVDESASQRIAGRAEQAQAALDALAAQVAALPDTELRVVRVGDDAGDGGTLMMTALAAALAEEPQGRIAGVVLITDGRIHDADRLPPLPAPVHTLLTGTPDDWDRRLIIDNAPAFAIMDEEVTLTLRIEDQGAAPSGGTGLAELAIAIDGGPPMRFQVPIGERMDLPLTLPHAGINVLEFETPLQDGELTDRNNRTVVQINGVRDRLRVLLVSGEPHPGERTWRNLLKSDSAVDLVHFTILRPPEKQDGIPVEELSLIAFPTRELFVEKVSEFDLIIFDRYRRRGILPDEYLANVADYVAEGGAVLVSGGPEFADAESIWRSPLGAILPAAPTAQVLEEGYVPLLTETGQRHPVTEGLEDFAPAPTVDGVPGWGRWFRLVDVAPVEGAQTVMAGPGESPLLILNRVGQGRVALLASDHIWLWDRGFEGGGPQLELLRRLAHWLMQEPELEEEALWVEPNGLSMRIIRRTLGETVPEVTVTGPDGTTTTLALTQVTPGRFELLWEAPEIGLYRLTDGTEEAVIALGPPAPREFEETIADGALLAAALGGTGGGVLALSDGTPDLRTVREGRPATGRGWIGIVPREAYLTADITVTPALPAWAWLILAAALMVGGWLREGRRRA